MSFLGNLGEFLLSAITGILFVHLLWEAKGAKALAFQVFLGLGLGPGLTSLLYFLYLLAFAGRHFFLFVQLGILILAAWLVLRREPIDFRMGRPRLRLEFWQAALIAGSLPVIAFAVIGASSVWLHRPYGTWDAFMIYDRTARFIYRGGPDWMQSFSPEIDPAFHADYPLLIPLNIALNWDVLGRESQTAPRLLSGIFMLACAGVLFGGLAWLKSTWQGILGLVLLLNSWVFIMYGPSQTADIPLAFFMLATVVLFCLYEREHEPGLLILAGFSAGLAGWTKNEGQLFLLAMALGLLLAFVGAKPLRRLGWFLTGLAFPLVVLLYFKVFLSPANDILGSGPGGLAQRMLDGSRHRAILGAFLGQGLGMGGAAISVIVVLGAYALIFGIPRPGTMGRAYLAIFLTCIAQAAGYYAIYLITPNPIDWQLDFSLARILFHIYVPLLFLFFLLVTDVRDALHPKPSAENALAEAAG